jgi:hypothetical protein
METEFQKARALIQQAKRAGNRVVFIDESSFTRKTVQTHAYS